MKKIAVVLALSLLAGCSQNVSPIEESEQVQVKLKASPQTIEEKSSFYIHDDLMPTYGMLKSYPSESLIDWDPDTGVTSTEWLSFELLKTEPVRSIELMTSGVTRVEVEVGSMMAMYTINQPHQIIELEDSILTDTVRIRTDHGQITDVHIAYDIAVDQKTYEVYQQIDDGLLRLETFAWSSEPAEAFGVLDEVLSMISVTEIEFLTKDMDLSRLRLSPKGVGCPYALMGKVISVKQRHHYYELTVDSIVDNEQITVFTKNAYQVNNIFSEGCILIDKNETMKFITIQ